MSKLTIEQLKEKLKDRKWRLNNLYWIKNKKGKKVLLKFNWAQEILFELLWYLNIILKVRQLGVTTFFCIFNLDSTLFDMVDSGIIAHRREDSERIFADKIKYAWDAMSPAIKDMFTVDSSSTRQLKFIRKSDGLKSSVYVGTSLRSATVQRLHISELPTIDEMYPKKAKEIRTGALNTVIEGQVVTIEGTAKEEVGSFADLCETAMELKKLDTTLTKMDYRFFFFPWFLHDEYELVADIDFTTEQIKYFNEIKDYWRSTKPEIDTLLTKEKMNWYVKKKETQKFEMYKEFPSTPEEAFYVSMEGKYYAEEIQIAYDEKRIVPTIQPRTEYLCDTWWDLGNDDHMTILITQEIAHQIRIIDSVSGEGNGINKYVRILQNLPYNYRSHNMPHDAGPARISGEGESIKKQAQKLGLRNVKLVPMVKKVEGRSAVRMIFNGLCIDSTRGKNPQFLKAIKHHHKIWDENKNKFLKDAHDDDSCHWSDTLMYLAVAYKWDRSGGLGSIYREQRRAKRQQDRSVTGR